MKKRFFGVIAAALLATSVPIVRAAPTILYTTDFNSAGNHTGDFASSASYTDGAIIGQDSWLITGTSVVNPINVANTATNGNVSLNTNGQDVNRIFTPVVNSGSVFLSADINVTTPAATGDYFIHLDDGTSSGFFDRVFVKAATGGFVMAVGTSSGATPTYGTTVLTTGTTYHIVAEYDFVGGGTTNDTASLFVNPTDPIIGGDNLYVAGTTQGTDGSQITGVNLRQGAAASAPTVTVDNIIVATVAPVPEPTSIAFAAMAVFGLVGVRRRKSV